MNGEGEEGMKEGGAWSKSWVTELGGPMTVYDAFDCGKLT